MKLDIKASAHTYSVHIQRDCLSHLSDYLDMSKKYIIITDDGIPVIYKDILMKQLNQSSIITIKQGESSKNIDVYQSLVNKLINLSVSKGDCLISLGGGVIGDLTGFLAATYLRGIDYIQIPTNLLAQVDASVGGKTGINFLTFKNIIGQIYPPQIVLIDPETLKTLPKRHFNNGMAEIIKYALIGSKELLNLIQENNYLDYLDKIIYLSLQIKKSIIEKDEFDLKERHLLNFGHTLGHAYESYYQYEKYFHGEAVALGMVPMIENLELRKLIIHLLKKYNLPTRDPLDKNKLYKFIVKDKKRNHDLIDIIILNDIEKPIIKTINILDIKKKFKEV